MKVWVWQGRVTGIPFAVTQSDEEPEHAPGRFAAAGIDGIWVEYVPAVVI